MQATAFTGRSGARPRWFAVLVASMLALPATTLVASPSEVGGGSTGDVRVGATAGETTEAGSSGNELRIGFSFDPFLTQVEGTISIRIPKPASGTSWTTPQTTDSALPGFVSRLKETCTRVGVPKVNGTAPGPFTLKVAIDCPGTATFAVSYGNVTSPTLAARYNFVTKYKPIGTPTFMSLGTKPIFNVVAGPGVGLSVAVPSLAIIEGMEPTQKMTVRAVDGYGNTAKTVNGSAALSYAVNCTSDMDHVGVQPASITLTNGQGSRSWTPPFMNKYPGVAAGSCYVGTQLRPAITRVTATLNGLNGSGSNRVRSLVPIPGGAVDACNGIPGVVLRTPGGKDACATTFLVDEVTTGSAGGLVIVGTLRDADGDPIEKVKVNGTDPASENIVVSGGVGKGLPILPSSAESEIAIAAFCETLVEIQAYSWLQACPKPAENVAHDAAMFVYAVPVDTGGAKDVTIYWTDIGTP